MNCRTSGLRESEGHKLFNKKTPAGRMREREGPKRLAPSFFCSPGISWLESLWWVFGTLDEICIRKEGKHSEHFLLRHIFHANRNVILS